MSKSTFITELLDNAALVKMATCADNNGPTDIVPALFYSNGKDSGMLVLDPEDFEDTCEWLVYALAFMGQKYGPFVKIGLVSDSLARDFGEDEDPDEFMSGSSLADKFDSDPASGVIEALICSAIFADGSTDTGMVNYSYGDDGMPEFGKIQLLGESHGGRIHSILTSFHKATQIFFQKG